MHSGIDFDDDDFPFYEEDKPHVKASSYVFYLIS